MKLLAINTNSSENIFYSSFKILLHQAQHRSTQHRHGTCQPVSQLSTSRHLQAA